MSPKHAIFRVAQKAFIERGDEILVLFFDNGRVDLPGGRIDEGERDLVQALKREIREETSLEVEVGRPITTWLNSSGSIYLVGYVCRYVSGEVTLSFEHSAFRWVTAKTLATLKDRSKSFEALQTYFALKAEE